MSASFIDTNVLVYLFATDPAMAARAEQIVAAGGTIGVQVLNELANVCRRKMKLDWPQTRTCLAAVRDLLEVQPLTLAVHDRGLALAERYNLSLYDAMICAAALAAGCQTLWSQDMQHGLMIDGALQVQNPFAA